MSRSHPSWALGLRIDGKEVAAKHMESVAAVRVVQDVDAVGSVALEISGPKEDIFSWLDDANADEGSPVEVEMGDSQRRALVFAGEITGLEVDFRGSLAVSLSLRGYDHRHRLMRTCTPQSYQAVKDSEVASKIGQKHGLQVDATATEITHPYLLQAKQSDYEFLRERARVNGFEVVMIGKTLHFRPHGYTAPPSLRLSAETELLEFHAVVTSMHQATELQVGGWDVANKRAIVGKAASAAVGRDSGPARSRRAFGAAVVATGEFPVASRAEAEVLAKAQLLERALGHVSAEATLAGDSRIHAGMVVAIADVGSRFSGDYYVSSASHDFDRLGSGRYETRVKLRRVAS